MSQIIRSVAPLNSEPTPDALVRDSVTPVEHFYVRNHGNVPEIDETSFRLSVGGDVKRSLQLSMDDLRRFPKVSVMAALQCAGNRRTDLARAGAIPGEVPWAAQAIGNAVWGGARLRDVLDAAGVADGARHVAFLGADEISKEGAIIGFGASVPIAKARMDETLLAYEMNGLPLTPIHGYPLRGLVPGFIGARSVKWLTEITVQDRPSDNFYEARSYKVFPPDAKPSTADWAGTAPIEEVVVNAVICRPNEENAVEAGPVKLSGYAIGHGGAAIARVDVSIDGGATWSRAHLIGKSEAWRWTLWEASADLDRGEHELVARATDVNGRTQPLDGDGLWNFKGYNWNACHRVRVRAT